MLDKQLDQAIGNFADLVVGNLAIEDTGFVSSGIILGEEYCGVQQAKQNKERKYSAHGTLK